MLRAPLAQGTTEDSRSLTFRGLPFCAGSAGNRRRLVGAVQARHILDAAADDVAPDGAWLASVLPLQRCRAYGAEMGQLRSQDHAALSHSTFFKSPALWRLLTDCTPLNMRRATSYQPSSTCGGEERLLHVRAVRAKVCALVFRPALCAHDGNMGRRGSGSARPTLRAIGFGEFSLPLRPARETKRGSKHLTITWNRTRSR
jgi:hypothetical protein